MKTIIGLTGFMGSGKDEFAKILISEFGFEKFSMAAKLKEVVGSVYGFSAEEMESQEFKATPHDALGGQTPRFAFQYLGTDGFRKVFEGTWVQYAERQLEDLPEDSRVVITDVRFENEVAMVEKLGGTMVGIHRSSTAPLRGVALHESEESIRITLGLCETMVLNDGTLSDLEKVCRAVAKQLGITPQEPFDPYREYREYRLGVSAGGEQVGHEVFHPHYLEYSEILWEDLGAHGRTREVSEYLKEWAASYLDMWVS